jgi:acyl phosphate:glycerol-3-phosphate acyltransferase
VLAPFLLISLGYVVGSLPTGVLLARRVGIEVQSAGSGNIGATNVARTAGRILGVLTLVGDLLKGLLPVLLARALGEGAAVQGAVAVAAIAGHAFSIFLRFGGGKGVATGFGALLALGSVAALPALGVFVLVVAGSRIVSLASLSAAASAPVFLWLLDHPPAVIASAVVISALIFSRHHENIRRLLAGIEGRFEPRSGPRA